MTGLRLAVGIFLFLSGLFYPVKAQTQQPPKVARIGWLGDSAGTAPHQAFLRGLHELGYVEGRNIVIEYRYAEGRLERLPALAAELVALKVDVIVGSGVSAALAAKQATATLPIVFPVAGDPVTDGLVASLAYPGGNATGLSAVGPDLAGKSLELLKQAVPALSRVAVLWQPGFLGERMERALRKETEAAGRALGVRVQFVEARRPADLDGAFSQMNRERPGALTVWGGSVFLAERKRLVGLAAKTRLPALYVWREFVDAGGLISYGPDLADLYRRAATYVDKILKGTRPGDLPVEQPTKFELVINLKAATALGLTIPPSMLARADEVVEK
jgi:putative ABC transport system substrate-binding protein